MVNRSKKKPALESFGFPPNADPQDPEVRATAFGWIEIIWRDEGLEATTLEDAIEMYAWELGYQRQVLPPWLMKLGEIFKIDVVHTHQDGKQAGKEAREE